ncbi:carbohydrate-binding domain-containing protein [Cavenderia fasciculata]|uniref:Carbohydrate-binding domain-containing protein n=1 Tax=Cavenderia fasciculata TaxID=261658 RepID=F4Q1H8_CACFS|nr:carbohydrate-binding domain-containing protein [Cavenderia fasciculata]EGG18679.1 carbohydrate-binding domain-containing protein [Cavenderia fasciculata]|eukprot:XP_004366583.1 carbohydrate-binding domain-containing protein [Cavenderia fasciculata]
MKKRIIIRFYVQRKVEYGQFIKLTGSVPGLGSWCVDRAINMTWSQDDWWTGEYQCESLFSTNTHKNTFKLEPSFGLRLDENSTSTTTDLLSIDNQSSSSTSTSGCSTPNPYHIQTQQSLSPLLKGISPQFIDLEYKYVLFGDYSQSWEPERNHKISFMIWSGNSIDGTSSPSHSSSSGDDELFIEIRDEWGGGNGVCPTLDFQASTPLSNNNRHNNSSSIIKDSDHNQHPMQQQLQNQFNQFFDDCSNSSIDSNSSSNSNSISSITESINLSTSHVPANSYQFLHPLDPHPVPFYPSQVCTFVVTDEGCSDAHSVLLVSNFFGSDISRSIQMIPIKQVGVPYTIWIGQLYAPLPIKFEYKYVVMSNNNAGIYWEKGSRIFSPSIHGPRLLVNNDGALRVSDASPSWITTGLVGLAEHDNNCSLLSIVHLLYQINPLRHILLNLRGKIGFPFTQCLASIFTSMEMGSQTTEVNPLQNRIGNCIDSGEILNIILFSLIEEIERISKISNYEQDICINKIFQGELSQSSVVLDKKGNIVSSKTNHEKFVNIILPVRGFSSLEESLKHYKYTVEHLTEDHSFQTIVNLELMPEVFIIQLDRTHYLFDQKRTVKICDRFSFPKKFIPVDRDLYRLKGIICHTGAIGDSYDPFTGGHYFLYVRRRKQWYKCDGSHVETVSQKEAYYNSFGGINDQQAYILIYEKQKS